jgi:glycosyltransferase involved in cell wall biosynthesis
MSKQKILLIEVCNYVDYPIGGYLSFAKQMVSSFGSDLYLVGMSNDTETPTGKWMKKNINGIEFNFLSVRKSKKRSKKGFIPERLKSFFAVLWHKKKIFSQNIDNVFIQTPEVLFATHKAKIKNLCVRIPGVENPLSISRYWYGKYFSKLFDFFFFKQLKRAKVILASADSNAITQFVNKSKNALKASQVVKFPTRVDTNIFKPHQNKNIPKHLIKFEKIILTTGRLSALKGWEFMLNCFQKFLISNPNSVFLFAGDGEERILMENYLINNNLSGNVIILGRVNHFDLANYLNIADLYVMGSYVEGWSTSLAEAVACQKPIVCTDFSSARDMVIDGYNGFVINKHDIDLFSQKMNEAIRLPVSNMQAMVSSMEKYSTNNLKESILENWKLI